MLVPSFLPSEIVGAALSWVAVASYFLRIFFEGVITKSMQL